MVIRGLHPDPQAWAGEGQEACRGDRGRLKPGPRFVIEAVLDGCNGLVAPFSTCRGSKRVALRPDDEHGDDDRG